MKTTGQIAIQLISVSKMYTLHHEKPTFVEKFIWTKNERFWALRDITLTVRKGERLGVVGPNGSGKTTLLKIIVGISTHSKGQVQRNGNVVSLIGLDAGFHPDLIGIENIFLNAMLIGMSHTEVKNQLQSIINFADIGQFIDAPLHTYSNGMRLRLGFAIAIHSNPDVLVLDENIMVGDTKFQKKSLEKIHHFIRQQKTIILVSHVSSQLKKICNTFLWLDRGKITGYGGKDVLALYEKESR